MFNLCQSYFYPVGGCKTRFKQHLLPNDMFEVFKFYKKIGSPSFPVVDKSLYLCYRLDAIFLVVEITG